MKDRHSIREATAADASGLGQCMESAYSIYQDRMGGMRGMRLPPMDVDYQCEIDNFPVWVIENAGLISGGLIMDFANDQALIANIAVSPNSQGQGIGGALMRFADAQAVKKGFSQINLTTHSLLNENLELYKHLGWVETDRKGQRVFMSKNLA
jgi:N-acetylglutamate synthase-like GNAT family acetyltransferase